VTPPEQLRPSGVPLSPEVEQKILDLIQPLSDEGLLWLSGYIAGFRRARGALPSVEKTTPPLTLTIAYGSQTGHSADLAEKMAKKAQSLGFHARAIDLAQYKRTELAKEQYFILITSTHGDGEPPDNARAFYDFLMSKRAPQLQHLHYAVLALGDSTYPNFCKAGKDFDARLEALGAKRLIPRADLDVDYEESAKVWMEKLFQALPKPTERKTPMAFLPEEQKAGKSYSKDVPFQAEILANINLNGRGSNKETHHIEISLAGSEIAFEPGDAMGVLPKNNPSIAKEIIERLNVQSDTPVMTAKGEVPLLEAMIHHYDITIPTFKFLQNYAELVQDTNLRELVAEGEASVRSYITQRHIIDILHEVPPKNISAQTFNDLLRPLAPRLYSIASSLKSYPEEAHLTVALLRYELGAKARLGVASSYLANTPEGELVPVFIETNRNFRMPQDTSAPIIMVGPGTGIAPFRAFMQEREAIGASGKNWLFFGEQHFTTDFLYQVEWQKYLKDGLLTRLDVAFSRDQEEKIYVQHRMLERKKDLYAWLEDGAYFYVCGDASRMAKDVEQALLQIIQSESGKDEDFANEYIANLRAEKRYQRDVY
jgi:sulfite reductase (NADPH) flavoprotein alpha-component